MKIFMLSMAMALIAAAVAQAGQFPEIKAKDLKKMLDSHKKVAVVDARSIMEYDKGHIPGAISVGPDRAAYIAEYLPKDKSTPVVTYCRGAG